MSLSSGTAIPDDVSNADKTSALGYWNVGMKSGLPLTWIFPQNVKQSKIFITNVEKTWISVISMEKSWKFEIGVKEKTWIFNFPLLAKKPTANLCNQRGKNVVSGDFYGKIVEI